MKQIIAQWACNLQSADGRHTAKHVSLLDNTNVYFHSHDSNDRWKYYEWTIGRFQKAFNTELPGLVHPMKSALRLEGGL